MSLCKVIIGAAYIGPYSEWSWIRTVAVIIVGIFLFWILYKFVAPLMKGNTKQAKKVVKVERKVITGEDIKPDANGIMPICEKEEEVESEEVIAMPFDGELMEITKVPDPIFSEKMVGDGFAIRPSAGEIVSPVNGRVKQVQKNRTSIIFETRAGREVILHIGLSTANLEDSGISLKIREGDIVRAGHHIGTLDLGKMNLQTKSTVSPVVFTNLKETEHLVVKQQGIVDAGMTGIVVIDIDQD